MLTRRLGKSGLEVSALGMGCWAIGGPWTWMQPGEDPFPDHHCEPPFHRDDPRGSVVECGQ